MNGFVVRGALALAGAGGLAATALAVAGPGAAPADHRPRPAAAAPEERAPTVDAGLLERARVRPAFRADRRRASVAYTGREAVEETVTPATPKPPLSVSGIIWGPEPAVLIEGVPGAEGSTLLRRGETVGDLRVVRIQGEKVVVQGTDTTWHLNVRNPWP